MEFATDYGLRNSLLIRRKGWIFLQFPTHLPAILTAVANHIQVFGCVSNDPLWLRGQLLQDFQESVQFLAANLSSNVQRLMTALGLIWSEWSGSKSELDLKVLAGPQVSS